MRPTAILILLVAAGFPLTISAQSPPAISITVDERGLVDRQTGSVLLDIKRPRDLDAKLGFTAVREVTAWTAGSDGKKKPIGFKVEYKAANKVAFTLSVDDHGGSIATTLEVFDKNISDSDGISPGLVLNAHPSYDWNRRCRMKEGVYECTTSKKNVVYLLADGASRFPSRKEAVASSPVKSIFVQHF